MNEPANHNLVSAKKLSLKVGRYAAMGTSLAIGQPKGTSIGSCAHDGEAVSVGVLPEPSIEIKDGQIGQFFT